MINGFLRNLSAVILFAAVAAPCGAAESETSPSQGIWLPNQWTLRPAGKSVPTGDLPISIAVSPDGKYGAVLHCGYGKHEVRVFDLESQRQVSAAPVARAWLGCAFSPDGSKLFISGGADDAVIAANFKNGTIDSSVTLALRVEETTKPLCYPSGIAVSRDGREAYVALQHLNRLMRLDLTHPNAPPTTVTAFANPLAYPYKVVIHPSKPLAYVSLWGGGAVSEVSLPYGERKLIPTQNHPNDMVISADGKRLFVACANSNQVDVIDTVARRVTERLTISLYPNMPAGSTPNGLALSPDGQTLLVANADNNNLAVFDVSKPGNSVSRGFIPTGWYPTAVAFGPKNTIVVANGKGNGSKPNPDGPNPGRDRGEGKAKQYIGGLLKGSISFLPNPDATALARYTADAYKCSPLRADLMPVESQSGNPIPAKVGDPSPIKHVVYIVKENRTYDQVLGDMPNGNGDPSLCLFDERVSPNHHALAREWALLDNFYVEAEISADGHEWSMGAYANDYVEKTWPSLYGKHGRELLKYPAEGSTPLGDADDGHLWDRAKEKGITYRSYGEWVSGAGPKGKGKTSAKNLKGHFDPYYSGFDMKVSDLDRSKEFLRELAEFERKKQYPSLTIVRLPNDHTAGTSRKMRTPRAFVAQNDLALGQIIEGLSHSSFWPNMAIFVLEDDAQNGPDHVDAHRSIFFVASPYAKRGIVEHTMYSTTSVLRTMELILGLRPLSQFDAAARPMYNLFTSAPDARPYKCLAATYDINEMNGRNAPMQEESAMLNLNREDSNPDVWFNEIIWKSVHGADSVMPAPVRAAFVMPLPEKDGDDD
ncbi:MAG: bifunctional YncE family protein/alkaline phosphatase family protein [Candidatus Sumerlaeaceae bacterium]|nr:bifunctional YncE family protein/alkaline phosphatase family protein [Candidatus Sumerlaeaceae bacterium]